MTRSLIHSLRQMMQTHGAAGAFPQRAFDDCLRSRDYEAAAALLRVEREVLSVSDDPLTIRLMDAAHELTLACSQSRDEAEWHQRAHAETRTREKKLCSELQGVLELISAHRFNRPLDMTRPEPDNQPCAPAADRHSDGQTTGEQSRLRPLVVYCLGPFRVYCGDMQVTHWPNGKGKSIFKYLLTQRRRDTHREVLMDLFWPQAEAHAARNNLNVAIYGLRRAIQRTDSTVCPVLFRNESYALNPRLDIWVDYEDFAQHVQAAQAFDAKGMSALAAGEYTAAEKLYQGDFLEENRYEEWLVPLRQSLRDQYRSLLDRLTTMCFEDAAYDRCIELCGKMLALDRCDEGAHRKLMCCYYRQGMPHLSLRQFRICVEALDEELGVVPSNETTALYQRLKHREDI